MMDDQSMIDKIRFIMTRDRILFTKDNYYMAPTLYVNKKDHRVIYIKEFSFANVFGERYIKVTTTDNYIILIRKHQIIYVGFKEGKEQ